MALFYEELSSIVLSAAHSVHRSVGQGLLESVYQKAFEVELEYLAVPFQAQHPLNVYHRRKLVGEFFADIVVDVNTGAKLQEIIGIKLQVPA